MHLLNPLQAANQFCSFHSVTPLPRATSSKHSVKMKPDRRAVASSIPMHSVSGVRTSRSFHSIASSFHQPPPKKSKSASHPCLIVLTLIIQLIQHSVLFYKALSINPKNKKESKDRGLTKAHAHGLQG